MRLVENRRPPDGRLAWIAWKEDKRAAEAVNEEAGSAGGIIKKKHEAKKEVKERKEKPTRCERDDRRGGTEKAKDEEGLAGNGEWERKKGDRKREERERGARLVVRETS